MKGQKGDNRDQRTQELFLTCPRCDAAKNVATCMLYSTAAKVVACSSCKTSSSIRWKCSHSISWLHCPLHREAGLRCAGNAQPRHSKLSPFFEESRARAASKRLRKYCILGDSSRNSTGNANVPQNKFKQKHRQNLQERGHAYQSTQLLWSAWRSRIIYSPADGLQKTQASTNNIGSEQDCVKPYSKPGPRGPQRMPMCIALNKGSCPQAGWSISQYCEACRG